MASKVGNGEVCVNDLKFIIPVSIKVFRIMFFRRMLILGWKTLHQISFFDDDT